MKDIKYIACEVHIVNINFSALYLEVNTEFKVSHKIFKLIMEQINKLNRYYSVAILAGS
jgi:hypothetical protein